MEKQVDQSKNLASPSQYKNGELTMHLPAKPVKGIGYSRLRWRKDGILYNHDTAGSKTGTRFEVVARDLQIWFFELLPIKHKAKVDHYYYVTPDAWRVFIDNLEFWKSEWTRFKIAAAPDKKEKSKAKAKHSTQKRVVIDKKIVQSAVVAGYEKLALKGKLNRLKLMLFNNDSRMLAIELIKDAEPWLLECILAGYSVKKTRDGILEIESGPFFQRKKTSGWGTGSAPDSSIKLVFWLAVAKAHELGCCPKSIAFEDITSLDLKTLSEQERSLVISHILPSFRSLQSLLLGLHFNGRPFTTADLPAMESLSELTILGNYEDSSIKIESLEKHRSLKKIRIDYFSDLDLPEDQYDIIAKLECDTSSSMQLKKISKTGLRFLLMAVSQNDTTATNVSRPMGNFLDISSLESLPAEHATIITKSGVNVCLHSSCINVEIIEILTAFTGELHLIGNCRADQLKPMKNLKCALFFKLENELDEESAKLLAEFHAKMIQISCEGINEICLNHIIKFSGTLCLGGWNYYSDFEIDLKLAKILLLRKAPLKLSEDLRISGNAMAVLIANVNLDLLSYRRAFEKSEKAGKSTAILENLYDQNGHKEHLLRSTFRNPRSIVKVTNKFRSRPLNNQGISYLEAAASKLLQNGWNEVTATL